MSQQTILITGGAGFIASHLTEVLLKDGHRVLAIDDLSTGRMENAALFKSHPNFSFARASISNEQLLDRLMSQCSVVVHLAAAVGVKLIVENPVHTIETNVMGSAQVLKTALRYGCRVLMASTSEVYGKGVKIPFSEDDDVVMGPTSKSRWSYAASKMVDEFLSLAYGQQYGLEVVTFRLFNTVGPRQTGQFGMVIPRLVEQALKNEPITVYGDGQQQRCFVDVRDVVRALQALAFHPQAPGQIFNIGSQDEISILQLAERVKKLAKSSSTITLVPYSEAYAPGFEDLQRRVPDVSKLTKLIGWKPERSLDDMLLDVIAFERGKLK